MFAAVASLAAAACATRAPAGGSAPGGWFSYGPATPVKNGCPAGSVIVDVSPPDSPAEVRLAVFDATGRPAVVQQAADIFAQRGLQVIEPVRTTTDVVPEQAVLRYGPRTVGDAWYVRSYLRAPQRDEFDPTRADDVVDVVLGKAFGALATITEVNQAIAQAGMPVAPPGTCAQP
jgi:hypothetical protein